MITEFKKSLYYAFRRKMDNLSRLDFMRSVTQLTTLYHKAYQKQSAEDKAQINQFVREFLSQLTHDTIKTPQMILDDLTKEFVSYETEKNKEDNSDLSDKTEQLYQAIDGNNLAQLEFLLQTNRWEYNSLDKALEKAYTQDNFEAIHLFFQKGLNLEEQKKFSTRLLITSVQKDDVLIARQMIAYGADINVRLENFTLIGYSIFNTQPDMIKLLLENEADVHLKSRFNNTLLHHVAGYYHDNPILPTEELVKILVSKGLNIDVKGMAGLSPLFHAVAHHNYPHIKILLNAGANIYHRDFAGHSVLHHAVMHTDNTLAIIEELIKAGADVNDIDHCGRTPLFIAIEHEKTENVRILLNKGAKCNISDYSGMTPLKLAIKQTRTGLNKQITNTKLIDIIEMLKAHHPTLIQKTGKALRGVKKLFEKSR